MDALLLAGLLGAVGGLTRGLIGLLKALALKRRIIWQYWLITVSIAYAAKRCQNDAFL